MYFESNRNSIKDSIHPIQHKQSLDELDKKKKEKEILSVEMNQECFDCGRPDPEYISINNGIFICKSCVLVHYQFPNEISTIKPKLDFLSDKEILFLYEGGNHRLFNFVTLEFPGLQNYTPDILYKTRAMEYYRERLKYYTGMSQKPTKPDDLLAYKFIDEDCFDLLNRRKSKNKITRLFNYVRQKERLSSKINPTCNINCNFNGSNNSINFLNPEAYNRSINRVIIKPIIYKNNSSLQYDDNDSFKQKFSSTFSIFSPQQNNTSSKAVNDLSFYGTLSQKKINIVENTERTNTKKYSKFIYHSPIKSNVFRKKKTNHNTQKVANIYQKPRRIITNNNDEIDNNINKSNFSIFPSRVNKNESTFLDMKIKNKILYNKNIDRNSIVLEKENISLRNTINRNLLKSKNNNCENRINIEVNDGNTFNREKSQKRKQKENGNGFVKRLIYNKKIKTKYYPSTQYKGNNQKIEISNIITNTNYMSTKNASNNSERASLPMITESIPQIKINIKKLNEQYKKNDLSHTANSTCLYKNKTSLTKFKKKYITTNKLHPLPNSLINNDYEFSVKAYKDKKEQECVEKEALQKLLLEGKIDDKIDEFNENNIIENDFKNVDDSKTKINHNDNKSEKFDTDNNRSSIRNRYKQKKIEIEK